MTRPTTSGLSRVLGADAAWDLALGALCCVLPLFTDSTPWPVFPVVGVVCFAFAAVLWWSASTTKHTTEVCRAAALGNTLAVVAALAAIVFLPDVALVLAIAAAGCTVFAVLEWSAIRHRRGTGARHPV